VKSVIQYGKKSQQKQTKGTKRNSPFVSFVSFCSNSSLSVKFVIQLFCFLLLAATAAQAQFTFVVNPGNTTVTITGYTGDGVAVSIPAATNGMQVTGIGGDAFLDCEDLAGITIPGSVTNIGVGAFDQCAGLTNVSMTNGVISIGADAFEYCASLASITIPASVTNIGGQAFEACGSLAGVYFKGDAPAAISSAFLSDNKATIYYMPGATGWKSIYARRPTVPWKP